MPSREKNKYPSYDFITPFAMNIMDGTIIGKLFNDLIGGKYSLADEAGQALMCANRYGHKKDDPYSDMPVFDIQNDQDASRFADSAGKIQGEYERFLNDPRTQPYPALRSVVGFYNTIIRETRDKDTYRDVLDTPFSLKYHEFTGMRASDPETKRPYTAEDYNRLLTDMHYPELQNGLLERIHLLQEMRTKELTPEERTAYAERLAEINERQLAIFREQMSPESEKKYGKYFEDYHDIFAGARGHGMVVDALGLENRMLRAGWDPLTVQDIPLYRRQSRELAAAAKVIEGLQDDRLRPLLRVCQEIGALDPAGANISSPEDHSAYVDRYADAANRLMQTLRQPRVQDALQEKSGQRVTDAFRTVIDGNSISALDSSILPGLSDENAGSKKDRFTADILIGRSQTVLTQQVLDLTGQIAGAARKRLEDFENRLDDQRKKNSEYYMNMREALEQAAELGSTSTPAQIRQSLEALQKTSEKYIRERSGSHKSANGQSRLDMAAALVNDAREGLARFEQAAAASQAVSRYPDKSLGAAMMTAARRSGHPSDRIERGMTSHFVKAANRCIRSIKNEVSGLMADNADRADRKVRVSDSYKALTDSVAALYDCRDTLNTNPADLMEAYRAAIKAADTYVHKHTGAAHMFSGNDKKGRDRVEWSRNIGNTLRENLAELENAYRSLPEYGERETPFERYRDMDSLAPGISKGFIPKSPARIRQFLDAELTVSQDKLGAVLDTGPPADAAGFESLRDKAMSHIARIAAASSLREWIAAGHTLPNVRRQLNWTEKNMPNDERFREMKQGVTNWEQLRALGEKARTRDAIGLTDEMRRHRRPQEPQRGEAPAHERVAGRQGPGRN